MRYDLHLKVHTPGVAPLATFNRRGDAELFIKAIVAEDDYRMELVITDISAELDAQYAERDKAEKIVAAFKLIQSA